MAYIRFQSSDISPYTGRKYGVFVAVWHLVRDKRVTEDEAAEYWRQRDWFEQNLPIPPFYAEGNPRRAVTWFKREALTAEMESRLAFYLNLGSRYGIRFEKETADAFTEVIYEDFYQVAVV